MSGSNKTNELTSSLQILSTVAISASESFYKSKRNGNGKKKCIPDKWPQIISYCQIDTTKKQFSDVPFQ